MSGPPDEGQTGTGSEEHSPADGSQREAISIAPFWIVYLHSIPLLLFPIWAITVSAWLAVVSGWDEVPWLAWLLDLPAILFAAVVFQPWLIVGRGFGSFARLTSERMRRMPLVSYLSDAADGLRGWQYLIAIPAWASLCLLILILGIIGWALATEWEWFSERGKVARILGVAGILATPVLAMDLILLNFGPRNG